MNRSPSAPDPATVAQAEQTLRGLNPQQRAAASHGGLPLLVVAGAGTGKTATLAHRVAYLIATGVPPARILLLTFTRRAATEMTRRVESVLRSSRMQSSTREEEHARPGEAHGALAAPIIDPAAGAALWDGTFHSIASRLLRIHGRDIGLEPEFTILDRGDAEDLMHVCRTDAGLSTKGTRFPQKSTCLDIYSRCVNSREKVDEVVRTSYPWCRGDVDDLKLLFSAYVERKEAQRVLDYDDLLLFWHGLLSDPVAGARVRDRFDHVLVDEYQDTNTIQAEIVSLLRPDGSGVTAVGDDAQAIYSFRAATVRNILDFEQRFPGAEVVTLEQNYRSTPELISATNLVIREAAERHDKELFSERDEGPRPVLASCRDESEQSDYLIDRILDHREQGTLLKKQAVLFRAAHHSAHLEIELARRNIPFVKYGGLRFVETAHVKDLTAFMRLAENPRDATAGMRVLGLLPGIGPKTAADLMFALRSSGGDFEGWVGAKVPAAAAGAWPDLVSLMRGLAGAAPGDLPAQVHAIRQVYAPLLELAYDNADARLRDLEQIESLASRFADRARLLTELAVDPPSWTSDLAGPPLLDEDYLILSTIHSAKGLEFDTVYVIHAADGNIPSDMATGDEEEIEEERRLFYVACTRARNGLYVTWPMRYYAHALGASDTHGYAQRTRFITEPVLQAFDQVQARPRPDADAAAESAGPSTTTAAIREQARAVWE